MPRVKRAVQAMELASPLAPDLPETKFAASLAMQAQQTTVLSPSSYHLLDHEYGQTPTHQIIRQPPSAPPRTESVKRRLNLEVSPAREGQFEGFKTPKSTKRVRTVSNSSAASYNSNSSPAPKVSKRRNEEEPTSTGARMRTREKDMHERALSAGTGHHEEGPTSAGYNL